VAFPVRAGVGSQNQIDFVIKKFVPFFRFSSRPHRLPIYNCISGLVACVLDSEGRGGRYLLWDTNVRDRMRKREPVDDGMAAVYAVRRPHNPIINTMRSPV
jgi:hypothetical protein